MRQDLFEGTLPLILMEKSMIQVKHWQISEDNILTYITFLLGIVSNSRHISRIIQTIIDQNGVTKGIYGRMDPIVQFQGTNRVISLDWDVIASSFQEGVLNHKKCSLLFCNVISRIMNQREALGNRPSSATLINTALFKVKFET